MYYLNDGTEVDADTIIAAHAANKAVLVHNYNLNSGTSTGLMLDGRHMDTRDQSYSIWDAVWTTTPTLKQALYSAYYRGRHQKKN